ncbi:ParB-like chromosome segregation protein Spo0J [Herbaspirillum sp. Sphag1AN]|nr:ParB-like chromosome segregation protein Spo0J [Herbaspirillum sp. Sphag1AN]MBB3245120.1 ParB-like chromosome segregation protein Spo0J [Herbaspirillum sp. Sphag64]
MPLRQRLALILLVHGNAMNITINEELLQYIDPLTANEYAALERSLLADGCRDALVLWGEVLIDGHNRYEICRKHGIEFKTVQHPSLNSLEDVMLWMIDNQLGRRSVTDFQRGVLALRKRDIISARVKVEMDANLEARQSGDGSAAPEVASPGATKAEGTADTDADLGTATIKTREDIARVAGISSNTISQIEKIRKTAAPELVEAVRIGTISINAAAAVASLPSEEQVIAVAGGKKELRQAAKMVREQKAASKPPKAELAPSTAPATSGSAPAAADDAVQLRAEIARLQGQVASLQSENQALQAELAQLRNKAA